jgi:hypothetical protein
MKKVNEIAEEAGTQLRDRSRSVKLRVVEIARVSLHPFQLVRGSRSHSSQSS